MRFTEGNGLDVATKTIIAAGVFALLLLAFAFI